jgi:hypothetical protein
MWADIGPVSADLSGKCRRKAPAAVHRPFARQERRNHDETICEAVSGLSIVESLFQGGRFSGLSAGTYTITWQYSGSGVGSPVLELNYLSLNAWASQ